MRLRSAWLLLGLASALFLPLGAAQSQDASSTIPKTPPATAVPPLEGLLPPQDPPVAPETARPGVLEKESVDEGAGWDAAVIAAPGPKPLSGEELDSAVRRINAYFNGITNLQGNFEQVDAHNKQAKGRFYVQRPGKLRFDYAPPSSLRIIADGHSLAIEDSGLKTIEKYPLDSTPFRLLLRDGVDLSRDARIVGVEEDEETLSITLEDKGGQAAGQIKLSFDTVPELQLKRWVITDAQGLDTSVTLKNVVAGRKVAADFFTAKVSFQPFR